MKRNLTFTGLPTSMRTRAEADASDLSHPAVFTDRSMHLPSLRGHRITLNSSSAEVNTLEDGTFSITWTMQVEGARADILKFEEAVKAAVDGGMS